MPIGLVLRGWTGLEAGSVSHLLRFAAKAVILFHFAWLFVFKVTPRRDPSVKSEELQIPSLKRGTCVEACALRNVLGRTCPGFKIGGNAREDTHEKFNRL